MNKKKKNSYGDGFDSILKFFLDMINTRYKIKKKIDDFKKDVTKTLFTAKRHVFRSFIELFFLLSGIIALVLGSIMFVSRFFSWDLILLVYGFIVLIISTLIVKLNP